MTTVFTEDDVALHGLHFNSDSETDRLLIYIHGSGSSNVIEKQELLETLAERLADSGVDLAAFNNRGSSYIKKLRSSDLSDSETRWGGMAHEQIIDSIKDIEAMVDWALDSGYGSVSLAGSSTGANKLALFIAEKPDVAQRLDDLFLIAGGDDVALQRARLDDPDHTIDELQQLIDSGAGDDLVAPEMFPGEHPVSARSFLELITPGSNYDIFTFDPNVEDRQAFQVLDQINRPLVFIYGSEDFGTVVEPSIAIQKLEALNDDFHTQLIPGADHGFTGMYTQLANAVGSYMDA